MGGRDWEHGAIVQLHGLGSCTATLIAPNLLLTAKHCVTRLAAGGPYVCDERGDLVTEPGDAGVVYVDAGRFGDVAAPSELFVGAQGNGPHSPRVVQVLVTPGDNLCTSDLALLILNRPPDDPELAPLRLSAPPSVGDALIATGFGQTLDSGSSMTLQRRDVTVTAVGPVPARPGVEDAVQPGYFGTTEGVCRGDSGSPALTPSGVVVGVASAVSNPTLVFPTGTALDCVGSTSKYQSLASAREFLLAGFATAGATPWREGEPDPRAGLLPFGERCARDEDCRSNACVSDPRGGSRCTHGCLDRECPTDHACTTVGDRRRCVYAPPPTPPPPPPPSSSGCSATTGHAAGAEVWLGVLALLGLCRRPHRAANSSRNLSGTL